jgi:hypothetical protein
LEEGLFPVVLEIPAKSKFKIPQHLWPKVAEQHKTKTLRGLAKEYGVSHEAVRRTLKQSRAGEARI